jgi:hypothetical protein
MVFSNRSADFPKERRNHKDKEVPGFRPESFHFLRDRERERAADRAGVAGLAGDGVAGLVSSSSSGIPRMYQMMPTKRAATTIKKIVFWVEELKNDGAGEGVGMGVGSGVGEAVGTGVATTRGA